MQLFRTLCVVAVLGALTYGAYVTLTGSPPVEPPLDAVNFSSPPRVELPPPGGSSTSSLSAPSSNTPAGGPAPRFLGTGAARLDAPTDSIAGTPLKASVGNIGPSIPNMEPPSSYPKTGAPPGPFDAGNSSPLPPGAGSSTANDGGPSLPGVSLAPGTGSPESAVTPVAGTNAGGLLPNVLNASSAQFQLPWDELNSLIATKPVEALDRLSRSFDDPSLSAEENRRVMETLDQLAGTVVYSRDHLLEPAHVVQPGERLDQIAAQYQVSAELLAKINGIADPANVAPGTQLKVVRGPFDALIDKSRRQLTVFVNRGMYAGSFAVGFGQDQPAPEGFYQVGGKSFEPSTSVRWLDLGNGITVHSAVDNVPLDSDQARGCIRLDPAQTGDVFDILSVGSEVIVRP